MERVTDLEGKCGANLWKVQNLLKIFLFYSLADFQCINKILISFPIEILCWNQSQVYTSGFQIMLFGKKLICSYPQALFEFELTGLE